ncbi:phage major capsid protein [Paludibacterium sp.]|uniref:phage major capsid protein n=1 Tax=Paludibacterium sp. TaxID=1917523 RepID=UPI0025D67F13|nr:phage major capsid protein [Paludibacterium sp.]MBV8649689.1 phage major capsid protein [Paludibacterium sp.]
MSLINPSTAMTEIVTTTLRNRTGKLADNVSKNNALLNRIKKKGKVKLVNGGRTIVQEMEYAENGTFKRYSGYEALNISPSDVFTSSEYNYAQAAVAISISGLEEIQNSGEEQIIDLLESRIGNAERTLVNNIALDCYSDGTADGGRQIGGLQLLISSSPTTGTIGGIDRSAWSFWRNQKFSGVTDGGSSVTAANIQSYMNRLFVKLVRGADQPDLIVADNNYYRLYLESLQAIQRITSEDSAMAGFNALKYMNADVVLDGGYGGGAPTNSMYFLNTDYIYFRPAAARNFVPIGDDRYAVNQDAMVKLIGFAGNMTMSNAFLQGVLVA